VIIFAAVLLVTSRVYDLSFDGNWYHKASVGSLANGWNPVYQSLAEFAAIPGGINIGNLADSAIWADHYCKAPWIFGANIYTLTRNIECAKALNILMAYVLFAFVLHYLNKKNFGVTASTVIAFLAAVNPITITQCFTFYIDGLLMTSLFTIIILLIGFSDGNYRLCKKLRTVALFSAIVICVNIKFTGLAYAGIFCLTFYILWLAAAFVKKNFKQTFIKSTLFYVLTVAVSVLLVGYSSYVKNTMEHGNPLYPLAGEESVDIMTGNQPAFFDNLSAPERLYYSTFSRTSNLIGDAAPELKSPFDVKEYELKSSPDMRIGGFGPLYGAVICFTLPVLLAGIVYLFVKNKYWFFVMLALLLPTFGLLLLFGESWWARYSPYYYILPLLALTFLTFLLRNKKMCIRLCSLAFAVFFAGLMAVNSSYTSAYAGASVVYSRRIENSLNFASVLSARYPAQIAFSSYAFYGLEFNFRDKGINYIITAEISPDSLDIYDGKAYMLPGKPQ